MTIQTPSAIQEFLQSTSMDEAAIRRENVVRAIERAQQESPSALRRLFIPFTFMMGEIDDQLEDGIMEQCSAIRLYVMQEMRLLYKESTKAMRRREHIELLMEQVDVFFKYKDIMPGFSTQSVQSISENAFDDLADARLLRGTPQQAMLATAGRHLVEAYVYIFKDTPNQAMGSFGSSDALDRIHYESPDLSMKLHILLNRG